MGKPKKDKESAAQPAPSPATQGEILPTLPQEPKERELPSIIVYGALLLLVAAIIFAVLHGKPAPRVFALVPY